MSAMMAVNSAPTASVSAAAAVSGTNNNKDNNASARGRLSTCDARLPWPAIPLCAATGLLLLAHTGCCSWLLLVVAFTMLLLAAALAPAWHHLLAAALCKAAQPAPSGCTFASTGDLQGGYHLNGQSIGADFVSTLINMLQAACDEPSTVN